MDKMGPAPLPDLDPLAEPDHFDTGPVSEEEQDGASADEVATDDFSSFSDAERTDESQYTYDYDEYRDEKWGYDYAEEEYEYDFNEYVESEFSTADGGVAESEDVRTRAVSEPDSICDYEESYEDYADYDDDDYDEYDDYGEYGYQEYEYVSEQWETVNETDAPNQDTEVQSFEARTDLRPSDYQGYSDAYPYEEFAYPEDDDWSMTESYVSQENSYGVDEAWEYEAAIRDEEHLDGDFDCYGDFEPAEGATEGSQQSDCPATDVDASIDWQASSAAMMESGIGLFAWHPCGLLISSDRGIGTLETLCDEPSGERWSRLNDYVQTLGEEAVEIAARFEEATGMDVLGLASDVRVAEMAPAADSATSVHPIVDTMLAMAKRSVAEACGAVRTVSSQVCQLDWRSLANAAKEGGAVDHMGQNEDLIQR
jgi:hypothetical protein